MRQLSEHEALLFLNAHTNLGAQKLPDLLNKYGSYAAIWNSLGKRASIVEMLDELEAKQINYISILSNEYPTLLKEINSPPIILYYKGDISLLKSNCLGVVGTRRATMYSEQVINHIFPQLITAKVTIVSGFQKGVDTLAHLSALNNKGKTIAVLGTGLDIDYPSGNRSLFEKIISNGGLIISEYPPQTMPYKANFPRRNRIISGLSRGVLIIEATKQSGSLITGNFAVEQNREVFSVPGSIFSPYSQGPHFLIQQGAKLVQSAAEICLEIGINQKSTSKDLTIDLSELTDSQVQIMSCLDAYGKHIDTIIKEIATDPSLVMADLTILELRGLIFNGQNGIYSKNRS